MKNILGCILLVSIINFTCVYGQEIIKNSVYPVTKKSEVLLLNGSWDFKYIKGSEIPNKDKNFYKSVFIGNEWGKIDVPSNWELQGKSELDYAVIKEGFGLYRTTFSVPEKFSNDDVYIRFEGVLYAYEVYVNGVYVGQWGSAYNSRQFNITQYLKKNQKNTLAVKVKTFTSTGTQWFDISDHWALSGIFRDVVLFSVPKVHFSDFVLASQVLQDNSAKLSIDVKVSSIEKNKHGKYSLEIVLLDPKGKKVDFIQRPINFSNTKSDFVQVNMLLQSPLLWTAETPALYKLEMTLFKDEKEFQSINEKVGIREITIKDDVLMVNNTPIKLKGVDMHEINPIRGSAMTDEDRKKDLELAKRGNINFIRTSHYPHHPRFFELADSLGFYVFAEVPFNYGPKDVTKNLDYLPHLESRAEATISRYKNRPSIIAWTIGNENLNAEVYTKVAEYVAKKDPTRPRAFPQAPNIFLKQWRDTPKVFNLLAPHYLLPNELDSLAGMVKRPIVMTEFAHSLGLSMENLEENWEVVHKHSNIAGGAIWMWSDQGVQKKKTKDEFIADKNPQGVWLDSTTYYDGNNVKGNDGIVYSNRVPQSDYWQVRKVYSPIWIKIDSISVKSKNQDLNIEFQNRFNFISLDGFSCKWVLKKYQKKLIGDEVQLTTPPNTTESLTIPVYIPNTKTGKYILVLDFFNSSGVPIYEKSIKINILGDNEESKTDIHDTVTQSEDKESKTSRISSKETSLSIDKEGNIIFKNFKVGDPLLKSLPVLRVGRKPTITLGYQGNAKKMNPTGNQLYWNPYLLTDPELISKQIRKSENGFEIVATYKWKRQELENEYIQGDVIFRMLPEGTVVCQYYLNPKSTGIFMEIGMGFFLDKKHNSFRWLGDGPFVSVPGKTYYNEWGLWALNKEDIRFTGNRTNTNLVAFYETDDLGIGFMGNKSNFAVENVNGQIFFNHNAAVSGFGTKVNLTRHLVKAAALNIIEGTFKIIDLDKKPKLFNEVFLPLKDVDVEKPFLKSYGF